MLFDVNKETCLSCSLCLRACPVGIIALDGATLPYAQPQLQDKCIACGHCAAICPVSALNLYKMPLSGMPVCEPDEISMRQAQALVRNRRSTRLYEKRAITRETVLKLLNLCAYAPSARNQQGVKWLVISNPSELKNIIKLTMEWIRSLALSDPDTYQAMAGESMLDVWEKGGDPILRGAPCLIINYGYPPLSQVDCIIAMSYLELLAPVYGLGGCWGGYVMLAMQNYPPLRTSLKIGSASQPYGALMLGYAQANFRRWPTRKPAAVNWR